MTGFDLIPYGPAALLLQLRPERLTEADPLIRNLARHLEDQPPADLLEIVPGFASLLLRFQRRTPSTDSLLPLLLPLLAPPAISAQAPEPVTHTVPVHYAGPDLHDLAHHLALAPDELVRLHSSPEYRVRCLGFMPGFAYLSGLDPRLHAPRRPTPRPRVPAGSVAIGGEHTGIYPVSSPGGWNLIGTTPIRLFDPNASRLDQQFLLAPGDRLRFVPTADQSVPADEPPPWPTPAEPWLRIRATGAALGIQDTGRPGLARFGVAPGGPLDPTALHWANRLLGNPDAAPALEFAGGGQAFEALIHLTVALTGADAAAEVLAPDGSSRPARPWSTLNLAPREVLRFRGPREAVWSYLALRGGLRAPRFLGSAATNARAGLGAVPVAGQTIAGLHPAPLLGDATLARRTDPARIPGRSTNAIRVWPGPQSELFSEEARRGLFRSIWRVSPRSDRVGYRLEGTPIPAPTSPLLSEPVLPGSIQVPPDGLPIVTLPDGPTVGGYPKIGWVDARDLWRLAQTPAGRPVEFLPAGWD